MEVSSARPVDILVVDDNPGKLLAIETALAPLGQNLVTATSGREALGILLERDFATIILDVSMPDVDGFETARFIRERPRSAHTPIIFVSAVNMDEIDARRGYSLGAVDYIFAPIAPEVLRAKVAVFVELHRKTEEARQRTRELEQSQRQLRLAERMAAIGTLSAGLGHDMGNLLLPIMARLDSLRPEELPPHARENVESIRSCVEYLRKLCSGLRLLALDPDHSVAEETTELGAWWEETSAIYRNALPRGVTLEFRADGALPPVRIARHLLTQAIFNLVQNAGEALGAGGARGGQSVGEGGGGEGVVRIWAEAEGGGGGAGAVRIGVSDDGPGMNPEVLAHCIDPFFTTKSRGLSTGLGLALVHGIVQRQEGELEVDSEPGKGATLSFVIPAAPADDSPQPLAVITLREPRLQSLAIGLARAAGFEVTSQLPPVESAPAVWITDPADQLASAARAFAAGRADRRVLVCAEDDSAAPEGAGVFTLSGGASPLRQELAEFLRSCAGSPAPLPPAPREVAACQIDEGCAE